MYSSPKWVALLACLSLAACGGSSNAGGNLYFSDLSDSWLTAMFPELITFPSASSKNSTSSGTLTGMSVVDTGLQMFLGTAAAPQSTVDIIFDYGVWTAVRSCLRLSRRFDDDPRP